MDRISAFSKAMSQMVEVRWAERSFVVASLRDAGFLVKVRGGRGKSNYSSGGRLVPDHDLNDWLWVDFECDGVQGTVFLQCLDRDPNSGNIHVLYNRVGVRYYVNGKDVQLDRLNSCLLLPVDELREDATTSFSLPFSDSSIIDFVNMIREDVSFVREASVGL